jgi:hypothetical protein
VERPTGRERGEERVVLAYGISRQRTLQGPLEAVQVSTLKCCARLIGGGAPLLVELLRYARAAPPSSRSRTRASTRSGRSSNNGSASSNVVSDSARQP